MRDFEQFENDFWEASWHLFAGRPVLTYDIYIEFYIFEELREIRSIANEIGGIYCYRYFYLWKLPCAAMFLFAILEFRCIECFAYALVSLVFNIFLCLNTYPSFLVSHSFSSVLLSRNCYVCLVPPHLQGPVIVRVVFVYPSFADPACSPSLPQSGSDDTYFYR